MEFSSWKKDFLRPFGPPDPPVELPHRIDKLNWSFKQVGVPI
jgi:hypothetical protein